MARPGARWDGVGLAVSSALVGVEAAALVLRLIRSALATWNPGSEADPLGGVISVATSIVAVVAVVAAVVGILRRGPGGRALLIAGGAKLAQVALAVVVAQAVVANDGGAVLYVWPSISLVLDLGCLALAWWAFTRHRPASA